MPARVFHFTTHRITSILVLITPRDYVLMSNAGWFSDQDVAAEAKVVEGEVLPTATPASAKKRKRNRNVCCICAASSDDVCALRMQ